MTYLHPSLEPILRDSMGVILYQEQVMRIAIEVAGFSPADSDGFRRAMGTWRSSHEMEKLHRRFVDGALRQPGMAEETAEELFRQVAAFASFGFAKSHAAAFARTAYESSFLKLFYPAQFTVGLINAQPMGFYPVEVLVNDVKRHGVSVLPVDINASSYRTTTEWVGRPGEPLPDGAGIAARPEPIRSPACVVPDAASQARWTPEVTTGWGIRLGLHLVKGIGEQHQALLDGELARGPYTSLADVVERTGLPEDVLERLIRTGGLDSLGRPRRELLWQLREVAGASRGRVDGRSLRALGRAAGKRGAAAGRPLDLRLPATAVPDLPPLTESERIGDAYAVIGLDARRQVTGLFRPALERLGAVTNATLAERRPGRVRLGGLVVTRQHPMTAKGTVFLAVEDETGMVNVTIWPDTWARLRSVVRRHALLLIDGDLQRDGSVVNVVAHAIQASPRPPRRPAARSAPTASARPATPGCDAWADPGRLALDRGLLGAAAPRAAVGAALRLGPAPAVRVRQLQEPAVPRGAGREQRAEDRRRQERRGQRLSGDGLVRRAGGHAEDEDHVADRRDERDDEPEEPARPRREEARDERAADRRGLDEVGEQEGRDDVAAARDRHQRRRCDR